MTEEEERQEALIEAGGAYLEHFGVKGMRWGVRKEMEARVDQANRVAAGTGSLRDRAQVRLRTSGITAVKTRGNNAAAAKVEAAKIQKRLDKKDAKKEAKAAAKLNQANIKEGLKEGHKEWLKQSRNTETANAAFQAAAKSFAPAQKAINNDPMFKGKDLTARENSFLARQHDMISAEIFNQHLAQASIDLTFNAKTERAVIYQFDRRTLMMKGTEMKIKHADDGAPPDYRATLNSLGQIESLTPVLDIVAHYEEQGEAIAQTLLGLN